MVGRTEFPLYFLIYQIMRWNIKMEDCCKLMRETDLPYISEFWETRRYENSYSFYALILWMSYTFARKKVTRMNACFQSTTETVLPFGGSAFVCSSNRCTMWETIYYQVMLHVWNSLEARHHGCPVSILGEPMWNLWWTEWYWYFAFSEYFLL